MNQNFDAVYWNVRGLNSAAKCATVHEFLSSTSCQLACLQETKLANVDGVLAAFLGGYGLNSFAVKLAIGTKGVFCCSRMTTLLRLLIFVLAISFGNFNY